MQRRAILTIAAAVACGPSPGDATAGDGADSEGHGDSTGAPVDTTSPGMTSTMPGDAGGDGSSSAATTDAESSTTAAMPDELPADAAGRWLCTGFEDPIYLRVSVDDAMQWSGTACGPNAAVLEPSEWTNCDELAPHVNVFHTQAYWAFVLAYEDFGGPEILFEIALDYMPATDTLEGILYAQTTPGVTMETCTREP